MAVDDVGVVVDADALMVSHMVVVVAVVAVDAIVEIVLVSCVGSDEPLAITETYSFIHSHNHAPCSH